MSKAAMIRHAMCAGSSRQAYVQLLRKLAPLRDVFLMGGLAEDALLHHEITRERADLDLLVEAGSWDVLRAQLHGIGIARFEPMFSGPAGKPLAFTSDECGIPVEAWLARREAESYAVVLPGGAPGEGTTFFRLRLPADTFAFPKTTLEGVPVQTVSRLALCLFRAASAQTRGDSRKRAEDLRMLERLAQGPLPGHYPEELIPEITECRDGA